METPNLHKKRKHEDSIKKKIKKWEQKQKQKIYQLYAPKKIVPLRKE
jgi:hypothetical protein